MLCADTGSLYFGLDRTTAMLPEVAGAVFFIIWVPVYATIINIPTQCNERKEVCVELCSRALEMNAYQ